MSKTNKPGKMIKKNSQRKGAQMAFVREIIRYDEFQFIYI